MDITQYLTAKQPIEERQLELLRRQDFLESVIGDEVYSTKRQLRASKLLDRVEGQLDRAEKDLYALKQEFIANEYRRAA